MLNVASTRVWYYKCKLCIPGIVAFIHKLHCKHVFETESNPKEYWLLHLRQRSGLDPKYYLSVSQLSRTFAFLADLFQVTFVKFRRNALSGTLREENNGVR